ncbi:response regulator [Coraliomargarita sp. SDUM461004]|uniref:histidine kinase n=1 Tax=Thalassobacterium sedimentorum TaxID=3041258 RepID=A0ABU1AH04_9BACT|nr:response regulator [Coraliomargarita sp. SDUM461004]MDQ8194090.1 response regulator [Coraliomargarita sp. SDUM461004]
MLLKDVLVVDDESLMREALELSLRDEFRVVKACSGAEALELSEQQVFPVVVLDLRMEGLDGIATLKKLRQKDAHQKVVILTAHQSMDSAIEAINLGAHSYMTKPCNFRELRSVLSQAHDRYFEEQLRTEELRKRLLEMHDDLFSLLCHEFNTPLNGIIGFSSILEDELQDKENKHMAGLIKNSAEDLHGVFVEILDHVQSKLPAQPEVKDSFTLLELNQYLNSKREEWRREFVLAGKDWQGQQSVRGSFHSIKAILSKLILASCPENAPARINVQMLNKQLIFNVTNLNLESRFGILEDPDTVFSPYTTSKFARRSFDSGVGLHLATSKNLAETAGMELITTRNENGLIDIRLSADISISA